VTGQPARHTHEWTALWDHFGPYGDKDSHFHACFDRRCHHMLVGKKRDCDGKIVAHEIRKP